ncbi:MAG: lytic transglycosylase domain-containing protein [Jiangellaceae bacterium]
MKSARRPNVALIRDTDGGALDGDTTYDRAVGPMQFIPSTWRSVSVDGNGDGRRDPNNIYDAAQGAAVYLCAGDTDLRDPIQAARAVRRYNNADE